LPIDELPDFAFFAGTLIEFAPPTFSTVLIVLGVFPSNLAGTSFAAPALFPLDAFVELLALPAYLVFASLFMLFVFGLVMAVVFLPLLIVFLVAIFSS
jgi:hypothetical protein